MLRGHPLQVPAWLLCLVKISLLGYVGEETHCAASEVLITEGGHIATPFQKLRNELYPDVDPYALLASPYGRPYTPQDRYPDSHLTPDLVRVVLGVLKEPSLWLEVGSFVGSSAITTAATLKSLNLTTGMVCIDPFTGVVDMWSTRKAFRTSNGLGSRNTGNSIADGPLMMDEYGHSRIYEQFLANVHGAGHEDIVMPIRIGSLAGMRLLRRLDRERRLGSLPQVIYLDSAHEQDETLLEVREAWRLLDTPGVLFGDDWSWPGVRTDVTAFARGLQLRNFSEKEMQNFGVPSRPAKQPVPGLALIDEADGTWLLVKE